MSNEERRKKGRKKTYVARKRRLNAYRRSKREEGYGGRMKARM
ncbi:7000_t:CDS:2 [Ambispora leptoticha]|uniref:7000_t:CDS:1 n=1 Tax=Ambispora leptoticha TaxID=144679 RepID=A0A9N9FV75_9GLOM|nr:7000_t:CDS:2 [Ambispora leptoticha]